MGEEPTLKSYAEQIFLLPLALPMAQAISRPDRNRRILGNSAAGDALRVHARSQIARIRADFALFSEMRRLAPQSPL